MDHFGLGRELSLTLNKKWTGFWRHFWQGSWSLSLLSCPGLRPKRGKKGNMPIGCKNDKRLRIFKLNPKLKTKDTPIFKRASCLGS